MCSPAHCGPAPWTRPSRGAWKTREGRAEWVQLGDSDRVRVGDSGRVSVDGSIPPILRAPPRRRSESALADEPTAKSQPCLAQCPACCHRASFPTPRTQSLCRLPSIAHPMSRVLPPGTQRVRCRFPRLLAGCGRWDTCRDDMARGCRVHGMAGFTLPGPAVVFPCETVLAIQAHR